MSIANYDVESSVKKRYALASVAQEPALCCPIDYDASYLKVIPKEILERDYGCGDPSKHLRAGETVLDLGSGGGKICYIASQVVGPNGKVIGVDFNQPMLDLARQYQRQIGDAIGHHNTEFRKGRIQDLKLNLEAADAWLKASPVRTIEDAMAFDSECDRLRREQPLVADESVDVVVSNCVLNLVATQQKTALFDEIFRVLKTGGRAVISDIVCDEPPTEKIMNDADLWSGCISGAFLEHDFLERFEAAGFFGVRVLDRAKEPWRTIDGIEFRSMTVEAFKGKQGPCVERNQAVIYAGPWKQVRDDDGHTFYRGRRMAVCDKTFKLMTNPQGPYAGELLPVEPLEAVSDADATPFDCKRTSIRHARETKGLDYNATSEAANCCGDDCC